MFEWDARKAASNLRKHDVSFEEAATVFGDPNALDGPDPQHSLVELRRVRLGQSVLGGLLVVAYTERGAGDGQAIRLISARRASRKERAAYPAGEAD